MNDAERSAAAFRARLDQAEEGMSDVAKMTNGYYRALQATGFPEEDAFQLVREWHQLYWSSAFAQQIVSLAGD